MRGLAVALFFTLRLPALDLSHAVVVASPHQKAITMLLEEVEKRTGIRWPVSNSAQDVRIEVLSRPSRPAEGYRIEVGNSVVRITGNDARGVLFGVGRFLRELRMEKGAVSIPDGFTETSAPRYPLRGHQLGYRPKTNSYDGWAVPV